MPEAHPPFAPPRAAVPCPALVACAARVQLGSGREALTGAVMAARLATGLLNPHPLTAAVRRVRAEAAGTWLGALTMPAKTRLALLRSFTASAQSSREVMAEALSHVTDVTAAHLDRMARSDLVRLVEALRRDGGILAESADRPVE